jgi:hypothetical protein
MLGRMNPTISWRAILVAACLAAAGCVHGYGGCLWITPVKHTLTGRVHFRTYPTPDGIDNVPVLTLDQTAYLYSPAQSFLCQPADELQLVGISEFPETVVDNSHVSVQGKLFGAASPHDHTRFLMNVITLLPDNMTHRPTEE